MRAHCHEIVDDIVHYAALRGHVDQLQKLIKSGVDINTATSGWVNVAEFLIANGASVNIVQKDGFSALHAATCLGHMRMCRYLLAEGSEVNRTDRDGWSPLHMGTCYGHPEVVRLFLSSGAKMNQKTRDEETALHIAVDPANLDIIGELIGAGATGQGRVRSSRLWGISNHGENNTPRDQSSWRVSSANCPPVQK